MVAIHGVLEAESDRLQPIEMYLWRRMSKTSRTDRKKNDQIVANVTGKRTLMKNTARTKSRSRSCLDTTF